MACITTESDCCQLFRGKTFIAERQDCCPGFKKETMQFVGNVLDVTIDQSIEKKSVKNYTSASGGNYCTTYEVEEAALKLTFGCANKKVFEIVSSATVEVLGNTASISDEAHVVKAGADKVYLKLLPEAGTPFVVTSSDGTTTYDITDDYLETKYGITIVAGGQIDLDAQAAADDELPILIDYVHKTQMSVRGLTNTGKEYVVVIEGIDKISGKTMTYTFPKVRFAPSSSVSVITDDISQFEAEGELFDDPCDDTGGKYKILRG